MITSETPEKEELRYIASLLCPPEKANKIINKPEGLNDNNLLSRLDHHGVTMLMLENNRLSSEISNSLEPRKAMMVANSDLKTRGLNKLLKNFNDAGLRKCILFKGAALAHTYYPQPWLRPSTDSDCLISPEDRTKYESILTGQLEFKKLFAIEGELVSYQSTYVRKLTKNTNLILDLHWRVNNRQTLAKTYTINELSERGTTTSKLNHAVIIPSAVDCILLSCIHRLGHHANDERLIWLYDIHILVNSLDEDSWEELCLLCDDKQIAAITLDALLVCEDLLETYIPENSKTSLIELSQRDEPSKLVLQRNVSEWQLFKQDLESLDNIQLKAQLLKENLFPSSDYIRQSMKTDNLAKGHSKRLIRGLKRVIKKQIDK